MEIYRLSEKHNFSQVARLVGLRALDPEQKSKTKAVCLTLNGNALTNDIVRKTNAPSSDHI